VSVKRVDEHAERQVALELRRRAMQDDQSPSLGLAPQLREKARLADPRLALDHDVRRDALLELAERLRELRQLGLTPDDMFAWSRMATLSGAKAAVHLRHLRQRTVEERRDAPLVFGRGLA
jgi:hypothetical protein